MTVKAQGFESVDSYDTLWIEQNHTDYDRRETGLYIHSTNQYSPQSIDDIPDMIAQLQAIYDEFEANKPKEPKDVAEALADFPNGTVIKFDADTTARWVKVKDSWVSVDNDQSSTFSRWDPKHWPFVVKYNPEEEAN